jgi:hypothetical protein
MWHVLHLPRTRCAHAAAPHAPADCFSPTAYHEFTTVQREIKVLVVGNGGVGKTSMIKRFCRRGAPAPRDRVPLDLMRAA